LVTNPWTLSFQPKGAGPIPAPSSPSAGQTQKPAITLVAKEERESVMRLSMLGGNALAKLSAAQKGFPMPIEKRPKSRKAALRLLSDRPTEGLLQPTILQAERRFVDTATEIGRYVL